MSLYKNFKTDKSIETTGIELQYDDGVYIKIARAGGANKRFQKTLERKARPYRRAIQTETFSPELAEEMLVEVYAESVILGWRGVKDEAGKKMEFSKENCIKLLTDLPDLFKDIQDQANKAALFRAVLQEDSSKN